MPQLRRRVPPAAAPTPALPADHPMPEGPLVSLVMPVWRPRADWLVAAVQSALDQRGCRIELVVVDDGCEEPVAALLRDVRDPRLRIVRIEHGGVGRARNVGMAAARGTRFRFVDCDDVLEPGSTAHLLELMGSDEDVIAYGATVVCDAEMRRRYKKSSRVQGQALLACLLDRFDVTIHALLFPRRVLEAVGEWEPSIRVCEDWDFTLRALEHARVRGDDRVAVFYRRHGSAASSAGEAWREGIERLTRRYLERHPEVVGTRLERQIDAMLDILRARWVTGGRPWRDAGFWRGGRSDPAAACHALRCTVPPALRGEVRSWRRRVGRALPASIRRWLRGHWPALMLVG